MKKYYVFVTFNYYVIQYAFSRGKYFFLRGGFVTGGLLPTVTGNFAIKMKKTGEFYQVLHYN